MRNKKMSDVYTNLPWREDGNVSFLYVEPEQNVMIAKSVNNHDRLTEENKQLREMLEKYIAAADSGSFGRMGQCYKDATKLLNK